MLQVKVVKASSTNALEEKINLALNGLSHVIVKDIKIAGTLMEEVKLLQR